MKASYIVPEAEIIYMTTAESLLVNSNGDFDDGMEEGGEV